MQIEAKMPPVIVREITIFLFFLAMLSISSALRFDSQTFANADPGWLVHATASLYEDLDLDLRNQLDYSMEAASDQTALGKNGQWYPLNEFFIAVLALPFYTAFGYIGCLFFNVVISALAVFTAFKLGEYYLPLIPALVLTSAIALSPIVQGLSYSFSIDMLSASCLTFSYYLVTIQRYFLAGVFCGGGIFSRLANAILLPAFYFLLCRRLQGETPTLVSGSGRITRFTLGGLPFFLWLLVANTMMFGAAFEPSYEHWQMFVDGKRVIQSQSEMFSANWIDGLSSFILGSYGLWKLAPLSLVSACCAFFLLLTKRDKESLFYLATLGIPLMLFSFFTPIRPPGSARYLMPAIFISVAPLAHVASLIIVKLKRRQTR